MCMHVCVCVCACAGEKVPHWAELDEGLFVSFNPIEHTTHLTGPVPVLCMHIHTYVPVNEY